MCLWIFQPNSALQTIGREEQQRKGTISEVRMKAFSKSTSCFLRNSLFPVTHNYFVVHVYTYCCSGKTTDINDDWIRYVRAIQWQLLDAVSSTYILTVLLSVSWKQVKTSNSPGARPYPSVCIRVQVPHMLAVATIRGRCQFISLRVSDCAATIRYSRAVTIWGWRLFEVI